MDSAGAEAGHLQRVFTSACERFRALPKADLHCHAMLSAPFEAYSQLAYECRERPPRLPPKVFCSFGEFEDYLGRELLRLLNCVEAREQIFTAALRQMEADRIVRVQCSFDAFMRERVGVAWDPLMHNMRKLARQIPVQHSATLRILDKA